MSKVKIKKGFTITNKGSKISDFNKFVDWLKICYDDVCREMKAKKTTEKNKIGIDFEIYEMIN
jgi:hypothetical protein